MRFYKKRGLVSFHIDASLRRYREQQFLQLAKVAAKVLAVSKKLPLQIILQDLELKLNSAQFFGQYELILNTAKI